MAAAGRILARCHEMLRSKARPGVTTASSTRPPSGSSARRARSPPSRATAASPARSARRRTRWSCTASRAPYELKRGDILSIDIGVSSTAGLPTRRSRIPIGGVTPWRSRLLATTARVAVRRRRAVPGRQPARRRVARGADPRRGRRLRDRSARSSATGSAARCTRTRRSPTSASPAGPGARGGDDPGDRADGQRRHPPVRMGAGQLVGLLPGRLLAAHFEHTVADHRRRPAHPDAVAR